MSDTPPLRRWSTTSLLGFGLLTGGLAYWAGGASSPHPSTPSPTTTAPSPIKAGADHIRPAADKLTAQDDRWTQLIAAPRTPATAREMAALLEALAATDPKRAMALAMAEGNFRIREKLRNAVLQGWAGVAPDDAAKWALTLPEADRPSAMEAVFTGAGLHPEEAARFGERLFAQNPEFAARYGQMLISALTNAGAYETAVRFSTAGASENHRAWLSATFYQWASLQPEKATAALAAITDPAAHAEAFDACVMGWAGADAAGLATHAMEMPPGADRSKALSNALDQWVSQDTVTAAEWISHLNSSPDLDGGISSVATSLNMVSRWPEISEGLAESISDPALRAKTLEQVARHWEENQPGAISRFIEATPALTPGDRAALEQGLKPSPVGQGPSGTQAP